MVTFLYELFPVVLFFLSFKFYGIYVATVVGIATTAVQLVISAIWLRRIDKKLLITLVVFLIFGGLTLYFHDPLFVKLKPTVIFWLFSIILFVTPFFSKKNLIERMLEGGMQGKSSLEPLVWKKLNIAWALFFLLLGGLNIYIALTFTTENWVNFKLYGITGILLVFCFLQAIYLARCVQHDE